VSEAWRSLKIKQFERVAAGPSLTLLRVTGKGARRHAATPQERPTLLADDGREVARFAALPSPPDDRGVLRAAYSVPERAIKPDTVFSLELNDGHVIGLPAPTSRPGSQPAAGATDPAGSAPAPPTPPEPVPATPEPPAAAPSTVDLQEVQALRLEVADANRRAEGALLEAAAAHDQREAIEQRNAELEQTLRERQAAFDELESWRAELERRLASMSTELGDATGRLRAAEQELRTLRAQPAEAEADAGGSEGRPAAPEATTDLEELRRRAAAEAAEVAARELAEAAADTPEPGF
jgi:hypothetical protein